MINNVGCTDPSLISEVYRFDAALYSSSYSRENSVSTLLRTEKPTILLSIQILYVQC